LLVVSGVALWYGNNTGTTIDLLRYWPVGLVMLGLELLVLQLTGSDGGQGARIGCAGVLVLLVVALAATVSIFSDYGYGPISGKGPGSAVTDTRAVPVDFAGVTRVRLDVHFGDVRVLPVPEGKVPRVTAEVAGEAFTESAARSLAQGVTVDAETVAGVTTVTVRGEISETARRARANLDVLVLPGVELEVRSSFGDVLVSGLDAGVSIETEFGDVTLERLNGPADVRTGFGGLQARDLAGGLRFTSRHGDADCDGITGGAALSAEHGSIVLRRPSGAVTAETTYGAVRVHYDSPPGAGCLARSTHGSILIEVPKSSPVTVLAVSERSTVQTDLPLQVTRYGSRSQIRQDLNGGGTAVEAWSDYGSVEIRGR